VAEGKGTAGRRQGRGWEGPLGSMVSKVFRLPTLFSSTLATLVVYRISF
jgi:hypothetical protein